MPDTAVPTGDRFAAMRAKLLAPLEGDVLEIGGGEGPSLEHYRPNIRLTFTEPDTSALATAAAHEGIAPGTAFLRAAFPRLPFLETSFDAVVVMRVLCSVPDAAEA